MKTKQAVYTASRGLFGTGHLIFTTLADLCIDAEIAVAVKTGYATKDDGEKIAFKRMDITKERQDKINEAVRKYGHLFDGKKLKAVS